MTIKYGFYDSLAGDRTYNAEDLSRFMEGVITDGIFSNVGTAFIVSAPGGAMTVSVGAGRAWHLYTWTNNDAPLSLSVNAAPVGLNRIDTVVIEINKDSGTRANTIKIITGTPGSSPVAPTLSDTATLKQAPLANIYVGSSVTEIVAGNLTDRRGSVDNPFIKLDIPSDSNNLPDSVRTKYIITPSVASGNLTLAIKYIDGNDCTTDHKVVFRIGNTEYSLTTAASFTRNAGTNLMNLGSQELFNRNTDLFVYAVGETGASAGLKFAFSRIPYGQTVGDFTNIATAQNYLAGSLTNYNATDPVINIGRFSASLSFAAGYNWALSAPKVINYPFYETDWLSWIPVSYGITVGSGVFACKYKQVNNTVFHYLQFTLSGTTITGGIAFSLPFIISVEGNMDVTLANTGVVAVEGHGDIAGNLLYVRVKKRNGVDYITLSTDLSASIPHVWVNTDIIKARFWGGL